MGYKTLLCVEVPQLQFSLQVKLLNRSLKKILYFLCILIIHKKKTNLYSESILFS